MDRTADDNLRRALPPDVYQQGKRVMQRIMGVALPERRDAETKTETERETAQN